MDIRYQDLVAAVERAINEADPIGLLAGGAPSDEYAPEIGTIIPPRQAYEVPARQIWDALLEYRKSG